MHNFTFRVIEAALKRCVLSIWGQIWEGSHCLSPSLDAGLAGSQGRFPVGLIPGGWFAYELKTGGTT